MLSLLGSLRGGSSFITRSLRFRSSASSTLSRTFTTPTNQAKWTWSGWVKRGTLGVQQRLLSSGTTASDTATTTVYFLAADTLAFSGGTTNFRISSQVFRDVSAWYHIVISIDTTQAIEANKILIYVNGNQITFSTTSPITTCAFNSAQTAIIGAFIGTNYFDGYLTEVNFIDGQALTPASFGAIDSSTGVWAPRPYSGTYGTNGFYLKFADASAATAAAIGKDSSGNGNNWTPSGISVTAGVTYDSMLDVPVNYSDSGNGRGNYATLNPLDKVGPGVSSSGNLNYSTSTSTNDPIRSTIAVSSGKWYWEVFCVGSSGTILNSYEIGIIDSSSEFTTNIPVGGFQKGYCYFAFNGNKINNSTSTAYGSTYTTNDVIGVALDLDAGTLTFYKNNVSQGVAFTGLSGTFSPAISDDTLQGTISVAANFGQRPFTYTPPAGFRALNTNNLPTPSIVNGANFMAATTYTGNAAARSLSNAVNSVSFQPDLVWIKSRTPGATSHALFDSTRGTGKYLSSDTTAAETTNANSLTAFNGDGFSLGTDTTIVNANANSYIAWQWRESITAGLDVVSYAGTGVNRTVAHNLGVAPAMIIVKRSQTGATSNWQVRHTSIAAANSIQLNSTNQAAAAATVWNSTAPTSSVFSLGTSTDVNASGISYVAYCFAEIAGFSKFGSYTGNGLADGPFVFCGFRPRFVMIKCSSTVAYWLVLDSTRDTYNLSTQKLGPSVPVVENNSSELGSASQNTMDLLSNGFKLRETNVNTNQSGATYIFAAFAEVPSKYALAR
jgi:hypothetical protein